MSPTPPTPEQTDLVDRAREQEKRISGELRKRIPMMHTYIQNLKPDGELGTVPVSDEYILSRVDFNKSFQADSIAKNPGRGLFRDPSVCSAGSPGLWSGHRNMCLGFMEMMFIDPTDFDRQHYVILEA
jgi:hypothetical protein